MIEILKKLFYLLPKGDGIKITILFSMMIVAQLLKWWYWNDSRVCRNCGYS